MPSDLARAEAAYLTEPEWRDQDTCDTCGHDPCSCDAEYEAYRDRDLEDER